MPPTFNDIFGQSQALDTLLRAYTADRLPHGLIFAGPPGVGKATTARALATLFLCDNPTPAPPTTPVAGTQRVPGVHPCGKCQSCTLMSANTHPDYHVIYRQLIRLEKDTSKARDLTIDVVRRYLVEPANLKASMNRGKVFVVEEAELMNPAAQNGLLKTLEEPFGRTLIILLADQPNSMLQTIRSRTQVVRFAPLDANVVVKELKKRGIPDDLAADAAYFAEGSLGIAQKWVEDGVIDAARELRQQLQSLMAGRRAEGLQDWFKKSAENYAARQLERDELASKDQATREGLAVYLRLTSQIFRTEMAATPTDPDHLDRLCDAVDAIVTAEQFLDSNVNIPLVLQDLSLTLERELKKG
jgi:DNA polymerase-3 subunit delta'